MGLLLFSVALMREDNVSQEMEEEEDTSFRKSISEEDEKTLSNILVQWSLIQKPLKKLREKMFTKGNFC